MPSSLRALVLGLLLAIAAYRPATADPPRIAVSIAPLHGLAAIVADGITTPALLVPGNASPHSYSLRPSEAWALDQADLVIWLGPELETFLAGPLDSLAGGAQRLTVAELSGLVRLPARRGGVWGEHDHDAHGHEAHGHEAHGYDEHADAKHGHDHEEQADDKHEHEHGHADDSHADHEHESQVDAGALDPHLWLDPRNAMSLLDTIAATLAELDPDNADIYHENARQGRERVATLDAALAAKLAPLAERPFVVFHDAYQYLESRYGLTALGAVTVSPDIRPGARRLGELRDEIAKRGARCAFAEPQFPPRVIELLAEETGTAIGVLDPLGAGIAPGRGHYLTLMDEIGAAATACLAGPA